MIAELDRYYDECGINPLNFRCDYFQSCIQGADDISRFTKGHGSLIPPGYVKGNVPRLLFLSLDSGSAESDQNKRTTQYLIKWCMNWLPGKSDKNKHWYRTHQFAWRVFDELNKVLGLGICIGMVNSNYEFSPTDEIHKIKPHFAHVNSAKCCMNNEGRSKANRILFNNWGRERQKGV